MYDITDSGFDNHSFLRHTTLSSLKPTLKVFLFYQKLLKVMEVYKGRQKRINKKQTNSNTLCADLEVEQNRKVWFPYKEKVYSPPYCLTIFLDSQFQSSSEL